MEDVELVFISPPAMGHLVAQVELAKKLVAHHPRLSVTVYILKLPITDGNLESYIQSAAFPSCEGRISLVELPPLDKPPKPEEWKSKNLFFVFNLFGDLYRTVVKRMVETRGCRVIGIITDMLIPLFDDVAADLGIPSYVLYTCGANSLAMILHLESLGVDGFNALCDQRESASLEVPGIQNPIPFNVLPGNMLNKEITAKSISNASRYRNTKGILVNTFVELESEILRTLSSDDSIQVYVLGPILDLGAKEHGHQEINGRDQLIIDWLDVQPPASVVFLCFGTRGSFGKEQVDQIAEGIERSGQRFLWSLRRQPSMEKGERLPSDYDNFNDIVPMGFLDRTSGIGKVIGWAPQAEVLAHPAVGAFVSHCGWNSVLESLWFGVPVVTWPMYAEQQLNAFYMVKELGIAVEITIDYKVDMEENKGNVLVTAEEIYNGIRKMMVEEEGQAARVKVKKLSEIAKQAFDVGGSSHRSLQLFTENLINNIRLH